MNARGLAAGVSALVAVGLGWIGAWGQRDFCLDDAYIHLDYALSLKLGQGFSYNPGDFETGSSSPLWSLLLALWPWVGGPLFSVKLLGVLLHACTAGVATLLATQLLPAPASPRDHAVVGGCAGLLVAADPSLLVASSSGMEVSLATALLAGAVLSELRGSVRSAAMLAALATLARPESLFFMSAYGLLRAGLTRRVRPSTLALGAACGLALWVAYCLAVSGWPWPNTKYIKSASLSLAGLGYLLAEVLPMQPWLVGFGGLVLLGFLLLSRRPINRPTALSLILAWLATLVAIAVSRYCPPGTQFYTARYFAIVAWVPAIPIALALSHAPRWVGVVCVLPVALVAAQLDTSELALQRHQTDDIRQLHSEPARFLAQHLPADAVVIVEGAGAARFYTPRSMRILDMMGLNDRAITHAHDSRERLCSLLARKASYLLLPDSQLSITVPLQVTLVHRFTDPDYHLSRDPVVRSVTLFSLQGLKPRWRSYCTAAL